MQDYPKTWYHCGLPDQPARPPLAGRCDVDVCIIGAGLAGLTCALELARSRQTVAVLEANRVGWGASGRNAGFVIPGFALDTASIAQRTGPHDAKAIYSHSIDGAEYVRRQVSALVADALLGTGHLSVSRYANRDATLDHINLMARQYRHPLQFWPAEKVRQTLLTERYFEAAFDPAAFHIHPLKYVMAIAAAAEKAGSAIYEGTRALSFERKSGTYMTVTPDGLVSSRHLILAMSAYGHKLYKPFAGSLVPVATYIAATQKMDEVACNAAIRSSAAISDTRRAGDYYRLVPDNRILWGGRITARQPEPAGFARSMRRDMLSVYPQLAEVAMDYAWSGLMGYFRHYMPVIGEMEPGLWSSTGFGGHGLNTTAMAAVLLTRAITQGDDEWQRFARYRPDWAGGPLAPLAAQTKYWFMRFQDYRDERPFGISGKAGT